MLALFRLFLLITLFAAGPAAASSSGWMENPGGAVRLITSGLADESGRLRGALEIRLKPGWKTYWRDPGDAGIPPQINLSGSSDIEDAQLHYPPPERISDAYASWAGYKKSVALPVVFTTLPGTGGIVEGEVLLGVCESICIPFQASFSFDASVDYDNAVHAMAVERAFAALPRSAREGFRVKSAARETEDIVLRAEVPAGGADPALFIAAPEGLRLAAPALREREGSEATFSAEIIAAPSAQGVVLDYTLVSGDQAVNGTISLP